MTKKGLVFGVADLIDIKRSDREKLSDCLMLLYLVAKANKRGIIAGATKLQKLTFLSEFEMVKKDAKGLNYYFFKKHYGPMSGQVYDDWYYLAMQGFLTEQRIRPTRNGLYILQQCEELFKQNKEIVRFVDRTVRKYGHYNSEAIKKKSYEVDLSPLGIDLSMEDLPDSARILQKIRPEDARLEFEIDDDWFETIGLLLDTEFMESLHKAMEDIRVRGLRKFDTEEA